MTTHAPTQQVNPEQRLRTLLDELRAIQPSTGPWKVSQYRRGGPGGSVGDNWLIARLGLDADEDTYYDVVTDDVHGSELFGEVKGDAEFIVWCRNNLSELAGLVERLLERRTEEAWAERLASWNALPLLERVGALPLGGEQGG